MIDSDLSHLEVAPAIAHSLIGAGFTKNYLVLGPALFGNNDPVANTDPAAPAPPALAFSLDFLSLNKYQNFQAKS